MQFFKLLAPAALVALASAQFYDDDQFEITVREEAPGYDDLGVFIRDDDEQKVFDLETREAELEFEETDLSLAAREADQYGDYDSLISLAEREADPEAEAFAEPEAKKKKSKKNKKSKGKGKKKNKKQKSKKGKKGSKKNKNKKKSKAQKKKAAAQKKQAKEDADIWGL